jgi:hypothetical protein
MIASIVLTPLQPLTEPMSIRKRTFTGLRHALHAQGSAMQCAIAGFGIRVWVNQPVNAGMLTTL